MYRYRHFCLNLGKSVYICLLLICYWKPVSNLLTRIVLEFLINLAPSHCSVPKIGPENACLLRVSDIHDIRFHDMPVTWAIFGLATIEQGRPNGVAF